MPFGGVGEPENADIIMKRTAWVRILPVSDRPMLS